MPTCAGSCSPSTRRSSARWSRSWKRRSMRSSVVRVWLVGAAVLAALPVLAGVPPRDETLRNFAKTLPLRPGQSLRVEHRHGDIAIRTHMQPELQVQARIRVSAESKADADAFANQIEIEVLEAAALVTVRTRYPEHQGEHNLSFSVDYDIVMPESAPLTLRNNFGAVRVAGLKAPGDVGTAHGALTFTDGAGAQRLENSFGSVEVTRNAGDVSVV